MVIIRVLMVGVMVQVVEIVVVLIQVIFKVAEFAVSSVKDREVHLRGNILEYLIIYFFSRGEDESSCYKRKLRTDFTDKIVRPPNPNP